MRLLLIPFILVALSGCAAMYEGPKEGQAHARLRVISSAGEPVEANLVECSGNGKTSTLGYFDPLSAIKAGKPPPSKVIGMPDTKHSSIGVFEHNIPVGAPLGVRFVGTRNFGRFSMSCNVTAYFVPQAGRDYLARYGSTNVGREFAKVCEVIVEEIIPSNARVSETVPVQTASAGCSKIL